MAQGLFSKVLDGRKAPIRGLEERNGRFYARIKFPGPAGIARVCRQPLTATTVAQAREELNRLKSRREEGDTAYAPKRESRFSVYIEEYLAHAATLGFKPSTLRKDRHNLEAWSKAIGKLSLSEIVPKHISDFVDKLIRGGLSPRTGNLYLISLRNLLKKARADGLIRQLPHTTWRKVVQSPERHLISAEEFTRLIAACLPLKNGAQLREYLLFLAYTGCREQEALRVRWCDVSWTGSCVTIGADGDTKNRERRRVDFSQALEAHLKVMESRRTGDSEFLFPSPLRGDEDRPFNSLRESLRSAATADGLSLGGFHDLRHMFISRAVMSGIDFMTIARWVGHKDGGMLIGKVYGHLSNEHRVQMAKRIVF